MMWFNCHDTAALIQCCPIINPFSLGTLMVNDYVLLVTRGRGGRGTHNQIYPGKVHRENMDTKHHQATHGNHSLNHSEDRRQIRKNIFHTCLFSPTSWNSVPSCPTYITELVFAVGIYWYMCGCNFTTYMRLIWEKRSESEFKTCWMWHKK